MSGVDLRTMKPSGVNPHDGLEHREECIRFLPPGVAPKVNPFSEAEGKASFQASVFNLSNAIMGSSILGTAYTMSNTGLVLFIYLYTIKYKLSLVIQTFLGLSEDTGAWYLDGNVLIVGIITNIVLPLVLMRQVIYKKFQNDCPLSGPLVPPRLACTPQYFTLRSETAYITTILAFAFVCHPEVLPISTELHRPSQQGMQQVANISILLMLIMCLLMATFDYLTFYGAVEPQLLQNYQHVEPGDWLVLSVCLIMLLAVILTLPVVLFTVWGRHVAMAVALLAAVNLLVIFIPNIHDIFGIVGVTSCPPSLIFILPNIVYICLVPPEKAAAFAMLCIAFMLSSLSFIAWTGPRVAAVPGGGTAPLPIVMDATPSP